MRKRIKTMNFSRANIWTKLLLAFSFIALLTVLVGVMALLIFNYSRTLIDELSEEHLPEIVQATEFARIGGDIVAGAPAILSASDDDVREAVTKDLGKLLVRISEQLETLSIPQSAFRSQVEAVVESLEQNLMELLATVALQVEQQNLIDRKTERLRWLYADLMGELDPLSQDYGYNVDAEAERIIDSARDGVTGITPSHLRGSMRVKEAIEKVRSNSVLLVNLMMQASTFNSKNRLEHLSALAEDAIALISEDMKDVQDDTSSLTLKPILSDIYELASGDESVFALRAKFIAYELKGREILTQNRLYVEELDTIIDEIVEKAENRVNTAASGTQRRLSQAKAALVLIIFVSIVTVAAVMWLYVRGNIVARLSALSKSMLAIARGDLDREVPGDGNDEIGRMAQAVEVLRDEAKERRRIEKELVQAGKLAALGQLSAGIAHELNQPLSAIRYYLHNASKLMELGEFETHHQNLDKMGELIERMAKMVNHLKTFARRQPKQFGRIDIIIAIEKAYELIEGKIEKNAIVVNREYDRASLTAYGDEVGLEQVLINIFSNAVYAVLKKTDGERRIKIRVEELEDQVSIEVSDNGPGLETSDPENVFDPFYTTKEVGQGLGLGLSISYNIVRSFGGTITVEENKTGGAKFVVILKKNKTTITHEANW